MLTEILPDQPDLFATDRWPRRPYCTDDPTAGIVIRSLAQALTKPYIQVNPPRLRVWALFDVDRSGAAVAWEDAGLPPPSWVTQNKANGHAHLVWGLSAPVLVEGMEARQAPMRYLAAVESLMRARLDADHGFGGLITKNPAHPLWRTLRGPCMGYELSELAECLPGIEKHMPRRRVEEVGLGRNVTLFDHTRKWAYREIRRYWGGGLEGWNAWIMQCNLFALGRNGDFMTPLDPRECWWIARSVGKWTWRRTTAAGFSQWQAAQGRKGGLAKGKAYDEQRAKARLMRASGLSLRAIGAELGVDKTQVRRWLAWGQ